MANEVKLEDVSQKVFGISSRWYRQLVKEGLAPEVIRGQIDFVAAAKALIDYYRKLSEGQGSLTLTDERKELVKVQRQLKELEFLVKKGKLIPRENVLQEFLNRIAVVKTGMLSLSRSLPGKLTNKDGREMGVVIKRQVIQLLEKFSRRGGVLK